MKNLVSIYDKLLQDINELFIIKNFSYIQLISVHDENQYLAEILDHFTLLRAVYFFHLSLENDRKVTELKFAVLAFRDLSFNLSVPVHDPIEKYDLTLKIRSIMNHTVRLHPYYEVWETFLFNLSKFYKRLRMVKYKFINMESLKKKKPRKFRALEPFYNNGQRLLNNVSVRRDREGDWETRYSLATLPARTVCVGCRVDLGGREAQLVISQPHRNIWAEDFRLTRQANIPCVLEMSNMPSPIVTCGRQESCDNQAKKLHLQLVVEERKALLAVMTDSRVCYGCSKYSLKTHKCSRCRKARYCSQDCLSQHWKFHRIRCEAGDGSQEGPSSSSSKKLEGEAKMAHRRDLLQRLVYYDPVMGAAMTEESADDH